MKTPSSYSRGLVLAATLAVATTSPGQPTSRPPDDMAQSIERQNAEVKRQIAETVAQVDAAKARALAVEDGAPSVPRAGGGFGGFGGSIGSGGVTIGGDGVAVGQNGVIFLSGTGGHAVGGTLIIPKEAADPKSLSEAEEDLNVMARILEKAFAHDENRAMGIVIRNGVIGGSAGPRSIYIEGYGALFFLNVNFPFLPPQAEETNTTPPEETNSEWEQTKRELYSPPGTPPGFQERFRVKSLGADSVETYSATKVDELKKNLIDALKNASHIRRLKSDEMVTVVVSGRSGPGNPPVTAELAGAARRSGSSGADGRGTRMIIRARKSDADAFQNNKISAQDFEKTVSVMIY